MSEDHPPAPAHPSRSKEVPHWAPKVPRSKIRRLYETDARGILDTDQIDAVGWALWERCDSILTVTAAHNGRVRCPVCGTVNERRNPWSVDEQLQCAACDWQISWAAYHQSYRGKQLFGANAVDIFESYHRAFPREQAANLKMVLIDQLIHAFHLGLKEIGRPAAANLIEGSLGEVIRFLDMLASGEESAAGISNSQTEWHRVLNMAEWSRVFTERDDVKKEDLPVNTMTQANKQAWDGLAETHYRNYHIDKLIAGTPLLNELIRKEVGDVKGKSLAHLLCHIGTDTLSWALLGAQVTGIDISPESLGYARELARRMEIGADFIEADVMEVGKKVKKKFDIVFSSTGVLCWLPDIQRYAQTVRHLLNEGGFFYIFDGHPFRHVLTDETGSTSTHTIQGNYFRKEVWQYDEMGDYTDPHLKIAASNYEWDWTLGDVVTAFCEAGMRIVFLHEFPQYFYNGYTPYDVQNDKVELFPCTFSLKAMAI